MRPGCLTAVCLFLGLMALASLFLAATYQGDRGKWYPAHFALQALSVGVAAWGLWRLKKWAVYLLGLVAVLVHILFFSVGLANLETFVIYAGILGPALYYYRRMA